MADTFVTQAEQETTDMANWMTDQWRQMSDAIGERPFGKKQEPERTQIRQGALVYHDPNAWAQIIQTQGAKPALEYAERLSRLAKKYPDEMAAGLQAATPPEGVM